MINKTNFSLHRYLEDGFLVVLLLAILYSKFLVSVSIIALFVLAILRFNNNPSIRIELRKDIKLNFRNYLKTHSYVALNLLFFVFLFSGVNSDNISEWLHHVKLKLPFLLLPFAFYSLSHFDKRRYYKFFYLLLFLMFVSSIPIVIDIIINQEVINDLIKRGKSIETPIDHIKYSLMVAIAVASGFLLWIKKFYLKYKWEKHLIGVLTVLLFIFIHLLAVRSGIACVYGALLVLILKELWYKNRIVSILTVLGLTLLPVIAYFSVSSFKEKMHYMYYDMEMYLRNEGEHLSDAGRLYSYKVAFELIKSSPVIGVGIGDLRDECKKSYLELYPNKKLELKYPHNEYLFITSGIGLVGLFVFLISVFYPLFYKSNYNSSFFLGFMVIMILSFLVENTIERSYSAAMYLFFVLLSLNYLNRDTMKEDDIR